MVFSRVLQQCKNIREYAYLTIKDNILYLNLQPNQKITELELVNILNIGKTPIREALIQLAHENLVYILPQSGTFISTIDFQAVEESHYVRTLLETDILCQLMDIIKPEEIITCRLLIKQHELLSNEQLLEHWNYDYKFHQLLFLFCNKSKTFDWLQQIHTDYSRMRFLALMDFGKCQDIIREHAAILDTIEKKDKQGLIEILKLHFNRILIEKNTIFHSHKEYFR